MNSDVTSRTSLTIYFIAALGSFLVVGVLAWFLYARTQPAPLNQARIAERIKNLQDITAVSSEALHNFAWQDQTKSLIRLPISNAMDLIVREYKNPEAARSNLLARVEKANPPPPPKEPEKPSIFE
jgi:hypothetical protein